MWTPLHRQSNLTGVLNGYADDVQSRSYGWGQSSTVLCIFVDIHLYLQLKERKSLRRHEDERLALRSQMNLEEAERRRIEDIKAEEKEKAEVRYTQLI